MTEAVVSTIPVKSAFLPSFYNALPEVEVADAAVRSGSKIELAHDVLAPLFWKHGVLKFCGINLLHKHWTVADEEIPEQRRKKYKSEFQLVTKPALSSDTGALPWSWALRVDGNSAEFVPFEFSSDEEVKSYSSTLAGKPEFFAEVGEALLKHDLYNWLGVCVALREPLSQNPLDHAIEVSSPVQRVSMVRPTALDNQEGRRYIGTSWMFPAIAASTPKNPNQAPTPTSSPLTECQEVQKCVSDNAPVGPPYHSPTAHEEVDPN